MEITERTDLNSLMADREITGKALAHAVGATESQVSNYRRGLRPSSTRARQIYEALKLSQAEIDSLGWDKGESE